MGSVFTLLAYTSYIAPASNVVPDKTDSASAKPMTTVTEALLRRDRWIVGAGLAIICVLSWWYIMTGAGTGMSASAMTTWTFPPPLGVLDMKTHWGAFHWIIVLFMWWVMMIAMMVPSAAPMILLYAHVHRHAQKKGVPAPTLAPTAVFAGGYLVSWLAFSVIAATLQWFLERIGLVHSMLMWSTSSVLSGAFLAAAGAYQLTPLKNMCLKHCRSPLHFLMHNWRKTRLGAFRMGLEHGIYCVGCCWFLMALLFVGGIMNLLWIAGLAIFVLLEKLSRHGIWFGRLSGGVMIAGGLYLYMYSP